jgi:dipeptidyl aminopeptidase/acylaminoacyl peptidase
VRLGDGSVRSISPDGKWVAASFADDRQDIQVLPTGAGETRTLAVAPLERVNGVRWFPDGKRLVLVGREKDRRPRSYELSLAGGAPKPLTEEGVTGAAVSPDGRWLAVALADNSRGLFSLADGTIKPLPQIPPAATLAGWLADSRAVLVREPGLPMRIARVDVETGASTPLTTISVADPAGIVWLGGVSVAQDGDHYTANYFRVLGELFIIDGLK